MKGDKLLDAIETNEKVPLTFLGYYNWGVRTMPGDSDKKRIRGE